MGWSFSAIPTDFVFNGYPALVVPDGNNVAWSCPCGKPVLFVYRSGRNGASAATPFICECGRSFFLSPEFGHFDEPPRGNSIPPANPMEILEQ